MKRVLFYMLPPILVLVMIGCTPATIVNKKVVQLSYKVLLADGSVYGQSTPDQPLEFMVGAGRMMPALEKAIMGLKVGDKKTVPIKAADAFGEYDPAAFQEVPKSQFPAGATFAVGEQFQVQMAGGTRVVTIAAVNDKSVTVDFNHPLAGKDITFEIEVLKIRDATKAELDALAAEQNPTPPLSQQ